MGSEILSLSLTTASCTWTHSLKTRISLVRTIAKSYDGSIETTIETELQLGDIVWMWQSKYLEGTLDEVYVEAVSRGLRTIFLFAEFDSQAYDCSGGAQTQENKSTSGFEGDVANRA